MDGQPLNAPKVQVEKGHLQPKNGSSWVEHGQHSIKSAAADVHWAGDKALTQRSAERHLLSMHQACLKKTATEASALAANKHAALGGQACLKVGKCNALHPGSRQPCCLPSGMQYHCVCETETPLTLSRSSEGTSLRLRHLVRTAWGGRMATRIRLRHLSFRSTCRGGAQD